MCEHCLTKRPAHYYVIAFLLLSSYNPRSSVKRKESVMRFSICVAISFFVVACAQQPTTQGPTPPNPVKCPGLTSPDQQLRACVLSVGRHPSPPFNESRVEIRNMKG